MQIAFNSFRFNWISLVARVKRSPIFLIVVHFFVHSSFERTNASSSTGFYLRFFRRGSLAKRLEEVKKTAKKLNYLNPDSVREVYRVLETFLLRC